MPSRGAPSTPETSLLLDVHDIAGSMMDAPGSSTGGRAIFRRGNTGEVSGLGFYQLSGATAGSLTPAGLARRFGPGANQTHSAFSQFGIPLGCDRSLWPASFFTGKRYVWDCVISRTTIFAGVQCEIGLKDDALELSDASDNGIILQSLSTLNAGRWTLQTKRLGGGGVVTGADSGVSPGAGLLNHIRFDYRDYRSLPPELRISVGGVLLYTVSGLAALPISNTGEATYCLCILLGGSANPGLGAEMFLYDSRFFIQELEPVLS
jgi:hypothetical protein